MLIEFCVKNYKSFRDKTCFSLKALPIKEYQNENTFLSCNVRLLKSAVIYGRNESGKTNLFDALFKMCEIVLRSTEESPNYVLEVVPFSLSIESKNQPTEFEVEFIVNNVIYKYGYKVFEERIVEEYLYRKRQRYTKLFERKNGQNIWIIKKYKEEWSKYIEFTRDNTLFLSLMANLNGSLAMVLREWFDNISIQTSMHMIGISTKKYLNKDPKNINKIFEFIKETHNTSILGMISDNIKKTLDIDSLPDIYNKDYFKKIINENPESAVAPPSVETRHHIYSNKRIINEKEVVFDLDDESEGINKLFALSAPIINALEKNRILFIDEFDTNLHPNLMQELFNMFNVQNKYSQIVIITHSPFLMKANIRRDQIYVTHKNQYEECSINRVFDYGVRKEKNLINSYLNGEFDKPPVG